MQKRSVCCSKLRTGSNSQWQDNNFCLKGHLSSKVEQTKTRINTSHLLQLLSILIYDKFGWWMTWKGTVLAACVSCQTSRCAHLTSVHLIVPHKGLNGWLVNLCSSSFNSEGTSTAVKSRRKRTALVELHKNHLNNHQCVIQAQENAIEPTTFRPLT